MKNYIFLIAMLPALLTAQVDHNKVIVDKKYDALKELREVKSQSDKQKFQLAIIETAYAFHRFEKVMAKRK